MRPTWRRSARASSGEELAAMLVDDRDLPEPCRDGDVRQLLIRVEVDVVRAVDGPGPRSARPPGDAVRQPGVERLLGKPVRLPRGENLLPQPDAPRRSMASRRPNPSV